MTPDLATAFVSPAHWAAVGLTLVIVLLTVGLHFEALERLNHWVPRWHRVAPRVRILILMFSLLVLHVIEIWLFGFGIHLASHFPQLGLVTGPEKAGFLDAVYLSATTYSTLGYGDLVASGPIRFLLGTEALVGLLMITWSASFTYLEMRHYWRN